MTDWLHTQAHSILPPTFRRLVEVTQEPFVQTIHDLAVPKMAFGRVCLTGDAAFVPRPHTAASTAKAAANAPAKLCDNVPWPLAVRLFSTSRVLVKPDVRISSAVIT